MGECRTRPVHAVSLTAWSHAVLQPGETNLSPVDEKAKNYSKLLTMSVFFYCAGTSLASDSPNVFMPKPIGTSIDY